VRNAQQLIDAATATGQYADYVGDGASVPWELVIPPGNVLLYLYKRYLDARWPEAFKLHDFLYTPYGQLIRVTREEADSALYEIIARDSIIDATIVYQAVRVGGAPYFGTSLTGFHTPNMALTSKGISSMPIKAVMLFKDSTGPGGLEGVRVAGWSESVWFPSDSVTDCLAALKTGAGATPGLLPARAELLPSGASINGLKLYQGGAGRGNSQRVLYPGSSGFATDVPNIALLCSSRSGSTGATRRWCVHAIPDSQVVNGNFVPSGPFLFSLSQYFQALSQFSFYTNPANPANSTIVQIVLIPAVLPATVGTGLATVTNPALFAANQQVRISRIRDAAGQEYSMTATVLDVNVGAKTVTLANWSTVNTTGGTMTQIGKVPSSFDPANTLPIRIGTRKVGRPTDLYRGRRSRRRIKA